MSITVCQTPAALFAMESAPTDTWSMILSRNPTPPSSATTYVHPLIRRSSSFMSKSSLEICTESLGCETGSGDFSDDHDVVVKQKRGQPKKGVRREDENQLTSVNYQSSVSRKFVPRSFPPPLSSLSSRDGTHIQMRTFRHHGHLVVEAVPVASQNYLNARRHDGRLQLSVVDSTAPQQSTADVNVYADNSERTTLETQSSEVVAQKPTLVENKLLYTSNRQNREEMLNQIRRCSEFRRSLFFWEAGDTASSGGCISC